MSSSTREALLLSTRVAFDLQEWHCSIIDGTAPRRLRRREARRRAFQSMPKPRHDGGSATAPRRQPRRGATRRPTAHRFPLPFGPLRGGV